MKSFFIDSLDITDYVASSYSTNEELSIVGEDLIRISSFDVEVWNEENVFTPFNPISIFYGRNEYESLFEIKEDGVPIYKGKVKQVKILSHNHTCRLIVSSQLDEILDRTCVYINTNITPAQAFYEILAINGMSDLIDNHTYAFSKLKQEEMGLFVNLCLLLDSTHTISNVIQQLASLCGADVFFSGGYIHFQQWEVPLDIPISLVIPTDSLLNPFEIYNDTDNIRNQYVYELDSFVLTDYEYSKQSRSLWGERSYNSINLSSSSDISSSSLLGLMDAGIKRIQRADSPHRYCRFSVSAQDFPYPFQLNQSFQFDEDISSVQSGIEGTLWVVVGVRFSEDVIEVKGMQVR